LSLTLTRVIDSLSQMELCTLLPEVKGPMMDEYKKITPTLAFLHEWPDDNLATLFKQASNEEMVTFLQIRTDMKDRALGLVPPMMRTILTDDLSKPNPLKESEQEAQLVSLLNKVKSLMISGEINLTAIFKDTSESNSDDQSQAA
jgi:flagellar motor switch protein FliG